MRGSIDNFASEVLIMDDVLSLLFISISKGSQNLRSKANSVLEVIIHIIVLGYIVI